MPTTRRTVANNNIKVNGPTVECYVETIGWQIGWIAQRCVSFGDLYRFIEIDCGIGKKRPNVLAFLNIGSEVYSSRISASYLTRLQITRYIYEPRETEKKINTSFRLQESAMKINISLHGITCRGTYP